MDPEDELSQDQYDDSPAQGVETGFDLDSLLSAPSPLKAPESQQQSSTDLSPYLSQAQNTEALGYRADISALLNGEIPQQKPEQGEQRSDISAILRGEIPQADPEAAGALNRAIETGWDAQRATYNQPFNWNQPAAAQEHATAAKAALDQGDWGGAAWEGAQAAFGSTPLGMGAGMLGEAYRKFTGLTEQGAAGYPGDRAARVAAFEKTGGASVLGKGAENLQNDPTFQRLMTENWDAAYDYAVNRYGTLGATGLGEFATSPLQLAQLMIPAGTAGRALRAGEKAVAGAGTSAARVGAAQGIGQVARAADVAERVWNLPGEALTRGASEVIGRVPGLGQSAASAAVRGLADTTDDLNAINRTDLEWNQPRFAANAPEAAAQAADPLAPLGTPPPGVVTAAAEAAPTPPPSAVSQAAPQAPPPGTAEFRAPGPGENVEGWYKNQVREAVQQAEQQQPFSPDEWVAIRQFEEQRGRQAAEAIRDARDAERAAGYVSDDRWAGIANDEWDAYSREVTDYLNSNAWRAGAGAPNTPPPGPNLEGLPPQSALRDMVERVASGRMSIEDAEAYAARSLPIQRELRMDAGGATLREVIEGRIGQSAAQTLSPPSGVPELPPQLAPRQNFDGMPQEAPRAPGLPEEAPGYYPRPEYVEPQKMLPPGTPQATPEAQAAAQAAPVVEAAATSPQTYLQYLTSQDGFASLTPRQQATVNRITSDKTFQTEMRRAEKAVETVRKAEAAGNLKRADSIREGFHTAPGEQIDPAAHARIEYLKALNAQIGVLLPREQNAVWRAYDRALSEWRSGVLMSPGYHINNLLDVIGKSLTVGISPFVAAGGASFKALGMDGLSALAQNTGGRAGMQNDLAARIGKHIGFDGLKEDVRALSLWRNPWTTMKEVNMTLANLIESNGRSAAFLQGAHTAMDRSISQIERELSQQLGKGFGGVAYGLREKTPTAFREALEARAQQTGQVLDPEQLNIWQQRFAVQHEKALNAGYAMVSKIHFDYSDRSTLEMTAFWNRMFAFTKWASSNLKFWGEMTLSRPALWHVLANYDRAAQDNQRELGADLPGTLGKYIEVTGNKSPLGTAMAAMLFGDPTYKVFVNPVQRLLAVPGNNPTLSGRGANVVGQASTGLQKLTGISYSPLVSTILQMGGAFGDVPINPPVSPRSAPGMLAQGAYGFATRGRNLEADYSAGMRNVSGLNDWYPDPNRAREDAGPLLKAAITRDLSDRQQLQPGNPRALNREAGLRSFNDAGSTAYQQSRQAVLDARGNAGQNFMQSALGARGMSPQEFERRQATQAFNERYQGGQADIPIGQLIEESRQGLAPGQVSPLESGWSANAPRPYQTVQADYIRDRLAPPSNMPGVPERPTFPGRSANADDFAAYREQLDPYHLARAGGMVDARQALFDRQAALQTVEQNWQQAQANLRAGGFHPETDQWAQAKAIYDQQRQAAYNSERPTAFTPNNLKTPQERAAEEARAATNTVNQSIMRQRAELSGLDPAARQAAIAGNPNYAMADNPVTTNPTQLQSDATMEAYYRMQERIRAETAKFPEAERGAAYVRMVQEASRALPGGQGMPSFKDWADRNKSVEDRTEEAVKSVVWDAYWKAPTQAERNQILNANPVVKAVALSGSGTNPIASSEQVRQAAEALKIQLAPQTVAPTGQANQVPFERVFNRAPGPDSGVDYGPAGVGLGTAPVSDTSQLVRRDLQGNIVRDERGNVAQYNGPQGQQTVSYQEAMRSAQNPEQFGPRTVGLAERSGGAAPAQGGPNMVAAAQALEARGFSAPPVQARPVAAASSYAPRTYSNSRTAASSAPFTGGTVKQQWGSAWGQVRKLNDSGKSREANEFVVANYDRFAALAKALGGDYEKSLRPVQAYRNAALKDVVDRPDAIRGMSLAEGMRRLAQMRDTIRDAMKAPTFNSAGFQALWTKRFGESLRAEDLTKPALEARLNYVEQNLSQALRYRDRNPEGVKEYARQQEAGERTTKAFDNLRTMSERKADIKAQQDAWYARYNQLKEAGNQKAASAYYRENKAQLDDINARMKRASDESKSQYEEARRLQEEARTGQFVTRRAS